MARLLQFMAGSYTALLVDLERARWHALADCEGFDGGGNLARFITDMKLDERLRGEALRLPFSRSLRAQCKRFSDRLAEVPSGGGDVTVIPVLVDELIRNVHAEMGAWAFFAVPADRFDWYPGGGQVPFGEDVEVAFPEEAIELAEAGRCFALARWTACVFHLMRGVEVALRQWCVDLGVELRTPIRQANMQEILTAASHRLEAIGRAPRSDERDKDLEYFGQTKAGFLAFKDAWRNHVAHGKRSYEEEEAHELLIGVRSFMRLLARRDRSRSKP